MANNLCLDGEDDIPASPGDSYPLAEMKTEGFCQLYQDTHFRELLIDNLCSVRMKLGIVLDR